MLDLYSMLECTYVGKFYYCWIWIVFYVEDCRESNTECCVLLVGVDGVMYILECFKILQNCLAIFFAYSPASDNIQK